MLHRRHRTAVTAATATTTLALVLAACSGGTSGGGEPQAAGDDTDGGSGDVELRLAWWGADARHEVTQEAIDAFEDANPGITVQGDFSDWDGYWDRLATSTAAGDMPDVIQMDGQYLATYAGQGSLAELGTLDTLSTDGIDPSALSAGEVDGTLYGVVNAINTWAVIANRTLIEDAGLELPDDTTWTWDDLTELATDLSEATDGGVYGLQDYGLTQGTIDQWARQHGETVWPEGGGFGVSEETLVAYWELALGLIESGGLPPASEQLEQSSAPQDQSLTGTNQAALSFWWSNQLGALSEASGDDLVLLRPPLSDDGSRGIWYRPSQYWSVSSGTDHPEEAGQLLDFLVNSTEAGEALLAERGTPVNTEVRTAITPMLGEADQRIADYLDDIADELDGVAALAPEGSSEFEATLVRYSSEVYFGSLTPEEAAAALVTEVESMVS